MDTRILSNSLGVEISGIEANQALSPEEIDKTLDLFLRHHLVVLRGQLFDMDQLGAFARQFRELEENIVRLNDGNVASNVHTVSNIGVDGKPTAKPNPVANYFWHRINLITKSRHSRRCFMGQKSHRMAAIPNTPICMPHMTP